MSTWWESCSFHHSQILISEKGHPSPALGWGGPGGPTAD